MMTEYASVDLRKWEIFKTVDDLILQDIELAYVFGLEADSALFVTSKDEVYGLGSNEFDRLGIGDLPETQVPVRIKALCGKQVICFTSGNTHVLALTKSGEVYAWGANGYGQIGNGTFDDQETPHRVELPEGLEARAIASGDRYNLALTNRNKLFAWGDTLWDCSSFETRPAEVRLPPSVARLTSISCGAHHATALTAKGQVLTWGVNDFGQLGTGGSQEIVDEPRLLWTETSLKGQFIVRLTCSYRACLALTKDGLLYAWGYNKNSALSVGESAEVVSRPQKVVFLKNIINIASNNLSHILCAESSTPQHSIHVWATDEGDGEAESLVDAFAGRPMPVLLRRPSQKSVLQEMKCGELRQEVEIRQGPGRDIGKALFNVKDYSDLTVVLTDGEVYVHTLILKTFSEHCRTLLDENWSNGKKVINMSQYNPKAYRAFLKYVYTGTVENLEGPEIIALCDIAVSYFEIELKEVCIQMFNKCLCVRNVAQLYALAAGNHSELVDSCITFASQHLESVILSEGFENLDPFLSKTLIIRAVKSKHHSIKSLLI